jgi:hypothetical protein
MVKCLYANIITKGTMVMVVTKVIINVCRFPSTAPVTFIIFQPNLNFLNRFE